jgi:hypothetical protein
MQRNDDNGPLKGYDAADRVVVEFDESVEVRDGRRSDTFVLKQRDGSARMVVAIEDKTVLESSFAGKFMQTAEHIAEDLQAAPDSSGSTNGSVLTASVGGVSPQTLRPQSLVCACRALLEACNGGLAKAIKAAGAKLADCDYEVYPCGQVGMSPCVFKDPETCQPALDALYAAWDGETACNKDTEELNLCDAHRDWTVAGTIPCL